MSTESVASPPGPPRSGRRGLSWKLAAAILVAVIVVVGGVGYSALSTVSGSENKTVSTTCSPPSVCRPPSSHDVVLSVVYQGVFGHTLPSVDQGQVVAATVTLTGGEAATQYRVFWGDGSNYTGPDPTDSHTYSGLGSYVLLAQALVGSTWYSGWDSLYPLIVTPNHATLSSGNYPTLATTFSNGSTAIVQFGWLEGSGSVNVSATYSANSTAAGSADQAPTLTSMGGTQSRLESTSTSVAASYAFSSPGLYYITMVGAVTAPSGTLYQNYTWTVYVSPTGVSASCGEACAECGCGPSSQSPHPGQIIFQEVAPGGATSEDPSVAYDTISYEPIINVYQTLVTYNGSSTASFLPQLSTCVPGPGCAAMYGGNTLIVNNGTSPQYFTFPIDPAAKFFDPSTGNSWSVYPSDVAFTFARTCGFANLPGFGSQPGWIQCQALLPIGNASWDSAIHYVFNNTPQNVLSSILINNTTYCPSAALAANGCVTFNAWGGGAAWPFFLELVSHPLGAGIEPCGWFTAQGAAVPGFTGTSASGGDGSCLLPGGAHASSDAAFQSWMTGTPVTYWDTFEELALNTPGIQTGVQWNMVGS